MSEKVQGSVDEDLTLRLRRQHQNAAKNYLCRSFSVCAAGQKVRYVSGFVSAKNRRLGGGSGRAGYNSVEMKK